MSILEYAVQAWTPWNMGDKEILEAVQRRAVKGVTNLRGKTYEERLLELKLETLEERRNRGDLLQVYRTITDKDNGSTCTSPERGRLWSGKPLSTPEALPEVSSDLPQSPGQTKLLVSLSY
jgi:hypothetical protein